MQYPIAFLEGIITFISPCLLPMLPVYISFFAGSDSNRRKTMVNAAGFVLGFTIVFVTLGAFAGTVGSMLMRYRTAVNIVTGVIVIILGLNFSGILNIKFLNRTAGLQKTVNNTGFLTSLVFGIIFSVGWTPCVGAFLASALMMASQSGTVMKGILMLLVYSAGLGIPFIISAVLIEQLKESLDVIKKHYQIVHKVSGLFLVIVGILMLTGRMDYFLNLLSF